MKYLCARTHCFRLGVTFSFDCYGIIMNVRALQTCAVGSCTLSTHPSVLYWFSRQPDRVSAIVTYYMCTDQNSLSGKRMHRSTGSSVTVHRPEAAGGIDSHGEDCRVEKKKKKTFINACICISYHCFLLSLRDCGLTLVKENVAVIT